MAPPPAPRMLPMLLLLLLLLLSTGAGGFSTCGFQSAASVSTSHRLQHRRAVTPGGQGLDVGQEREQPAPVRVQSMDYTTLLRVGGELRRRLVPGRVENALQPDDYSLMLQIRSLEGLDWLVLSWHPEAARVTLLQPSRSAYGGQEKEGGGGGGGGKKKRGGGAAGSGGANSAFYSLPGQLRAHLHLRTLIGVSLPLPGERVLALDFADRVTAERATHRMYVEVMGRRSNVVLVGLQDSQEGEVLACAYQVSPSKSIRPVSVGQPYTLPPPLTTPMPPLPPPGTEEEIEAATAAFVQRVTTIPAHPLARALTGAYRGMSPQLVQAMCGEQPSMAQTPVQDLPPDFLPRFFKGPFLSWLRVLAAELGEDVPTADAVPSLPPAGLSWGGEGGYTPVVFEEKERKGKKWQRMPSVLEAVDRYYTARLQARELLDLRRRGLAKVQTALGRLKRTRAEFQERLVAAGEASLGGLQAKAELLTTYAYSWKEGDDFCLCYAIDTGEEIRLPISPGKSAADEAQALYARVRKLRRSVDALKPLLEKVEVKIAYVEELEASLLQLATATATSSTASTMAPAAAHDDADASSSPSLGADGDGEAVADWGLLVSQDLAVMRELAEELGLDAPPSSTFTKSNSKGGGSSFFATILQRLSYSMEPEESGGSSSKGGGGKQGNKIGKGKGGGGQKKKSPAAGQASSKQRTAPVIQTYAFPSSSSSSDSSGSGGNGGGIRALVGRNSRQNDHVTFSLAKPHELWFHAQGVPGSHVLLRFDAGTEVSDTALQFAADLAAHFSKARGSKQVPVMYTSPKHLKRVVGGGPGMVHVSKETIVWGRPSEGEAIVRRQAAAVLAGGA